MRDLRAGCPAHGVGSWCTDQQAAPGGIHAVHPAPMSRSPARGRAGPIRRETPQPGADGLVADGDRAGGDDRHRHFRPDRHGCGQPVRTCGHSFAADRGLRQRPRRAVLCRVRRLPARSWQRLQLHLRDSRRGGRLVHRLESIAGVRHLRLRGRGELVGLRRESARAAGHCICRRTPQDG